MLCADCFSLSLCGSPGWGIFLSSITFSLPSCTAQVRERSSLHLSELFLLSSIACHCIYHTISIPLCGHFDLPDPLLMSPLCATQGGELFFLSLVTCRCFLVICHYFYVTRRFTTFLCSGNLRGYRQNR